MSRFFALRLWLDGLAAVLLVFGLSYWWLGNVAHELAGTLMFVLLIAHNVFNRRWYGNLSRTRREPRSLFNVLVTGGLLLAMLALLVTSILISNALASFLPPWGGFSVRQIHTVAAYWVLVIVAVHLGLRWPMLIGLARVAFGLRGTSPIRTSILRALTGAVAVYGIWSCLVLGLGMKLTMQMSLDWWNFEESVAGFFIHVGAIAGLVISGTYYAMKLIDFARPGRRPSRDAQPVPTTVSP
ncbi:MAG TPA: DUF4405 domain-containing protein [Bosea sp. (in: a-proteobacteria)]|jgi:ABC-type multidrug transport system permease subunit|uniref:DUF4405 domain-containing protein n=1 Tax=Bosea sp. (in: a-proteobacteria) TaxID=1871050 RepID=UPI002E136725|nr:DUF4405 domain-containing protein [Bosea sp. (in: a-proteobacteria)]